MLYTSRKTVRLKYPIFSELEIKKYFIFLFRKIKKMATSQKHIELLRINCYLKE